MRYGLTVTTAPTVEPVTTAEAKAQMRVDWAEEDDLIGALVTAARARVEERTRRALINQSLTLTLDAFPGSGVDIIDLARYAGWPDGDAANPVITLPRGPLQSVTSITYVDTGGSDVVLSSSNYRVDSSSLVPRITPAYGMVWPTTQTVMNAVSVEFVAGYGATGVYVPQPLRQAILILAATWFEHREAVLAGTIVGRVPLSAEYLMAPYVATSWAGS